MQAGLGSNKIGGMQSSRSFNRIGFFEKLHIDLPLLIGIILLTSLGLIVLYSAKQDINLVKKQVVRLCIAGGLMLITAQIPPRIYRSWAYFLYIFCLVMLIAVLFCGETSKGAQRWLDIGVIRFQPAELMKIAVPLSVAAHLHPRLLPPTITTLIIPVIMVALPVVLTMLQPDLGTAILIGCTGAFVIFFAGLPWRYIGIAIATSLASTPVLWYFMHDYQRKRVMTLLNPERDPLGSGYHIIQSKIAIGSGGVFGKGWLNGTQSQLEFLPERSTDFIFAVLGEEFGFLGILLLMSFYLFIVARGMYIGSRAQDTFSRLLAGSTIITFFVYIFVNIGMVSGILPVVGIPLPLISYGGTSLVTIMLGFGMLMSIKTHRTLLSK